MRSTTAGLSGGHSRSQGDSLTRYRYALKALKYMYIPTTLLVPNNIEFVQFTEHQCHHSSSQRRNKPRSSHRRHNACPSPRMTTWTRPAWPTFLGISAPSKPPPFPNTSLAAQTVTTPSKVLDQAASACCLHAHYGVGLEETPRRWLCSFG